MCMEADRTEMFCLFLCICITLGRSGGNGVTRVSDGLKFPENGEKGRFELVFLKISEFFSRKFIKNSYFLQFFKESYRQSKTNQV